MNVNVRYIEENVRGLYKAVDTMTQGCMKNVPATGVCAPDGRALCVSRWWGDRPQGGRGVDHPTKVQQKKPQTEIGLFSPTLSSSAFLCDSSVSCRLIASPGVLPTLESNMYNL